MLDLPGAFRQAAGRHLAGILILSAAAAAAAVSCDANEPDLLRLSRKNDNGLSELFAAGRKGGRVDSSKTEGYIWPADILCSMPSIFDLGQVRLGPDESCCRSLHKLTLIERAGLERKGGRKEGEENDPYACESEAAAAANARKPRKWLRLLLRSLARSLSRYTYVRVGNVGRRLLDVGENESGRGIRK